MLGRVGSVPGARDVVAGIDPAVPIAHLVVPGVGPAIRKSLLECFGSAEAVLAASPSRLRQVPGVGPKLSRALVSARDEIDAGAELRICRDHGISIIGDADPDYPRLLGEIYNPPAILFVHGDLQDDDALAIAIVGTRHATNYGLRQAE